MIAGGTPYIVGAYAFAYAVLVGYGVSLWRRRREAHERLAHPPEDVS